MKESLTAEYADTVVRHTPGTLTGNSQARELLTIARERDVAVARLELDAELAHARGEVAVLKQALERMHNTLGFMASLLHDSNRSSAPQSPREGPAPGAEGGSSHAGGTDSPPSPPVSEGIGEAT